MVPKVPRPTLTPRSPRVASIQAAAEEKIAVAREKVAARVEALRTAARARIAAQRAVRATKIAGRTRRPPGGGVK